MAKGDHEDRPTTSPDQLRQNPLILSIILCLHIDVMQVHSALCLGLQAVDASFHCAPSRQRIVHQFFGHSCIGSPTVAPEHESR